MTTPPLAGRAALAARQQMADELTALALPLLDLFLSDALSFALRALDGPVLLAAGSPPEPFSLGGVRRRFANRLGAVAWLATTGLADKVHTALGEVVARVAYGTLTRQQARTAAQDAAAPEVWEPVVENAASDYATQVFNERQLVAMARINPVGAKRWLARVDQVTRPSHVAANGQTVPINAPFRVGAELLQYPRDPRGTPAETYNCRCVVVAG